MSKVQIQRLKQLKKMGILLSILALTLIALAPILNAALRAEEQLAWQQSLIQILGTDPLGLTMMGVLFLFMGLFCLGSVWQKRMFLR